MKIYIASSWKHKHGVEMLTALLRKDQHEVVSWIENCSLEANKFFDFEDWVNTPEAEVCFKFDIDGATTCDLFIYYGASGMDACCEMGAAWSKGIEVIALYSKGESLGLMRKMVTSWFEDYRDIMKAVKEKQERILSPMPEDKPTNNNASLDFQGTKDIVKGAFSCLQCAVGQHFNHNCVYILNKIGNSIQACSNCGYENYFDVRPLKLKTGSNEES